MDQIYVDKAAASIWATERPPDDKADAIWATETSMFSRAHTYLGEALRW